MAWPSARRPLAAMSSGRPRVGAVTTHDTLGVSEWSITLISLWFSGSEMTASRVSSEEEPDVAVVDTA